MITRGVSAVLGIIGLLFMTRYLGTEQYGTIAWTLAFLATFSSIADLGFASAHTKRVSEGHDLNACVSTFAYVKGLLTLAMALVVLLAAGILSFVSKEALPPSSIHILLILLVYQVLHELTMIATTTYDARVQTAKSQLVVICNPLVRAPLLIFFLIGGMNATGVAYCYLAGGVAAIAVASYRISRESIVWQRPTMIRSYWSWAAPMVAVVVAAAIHAQLSTTTIGLFWPKSDVAYYSSSLFLVSYLAILGGSIMILLFPTFSKLSTEGRLDEIKETSKLGERYLSLISLPIVTTIIVFPDQIAVIVFGGEFLNAGEVLPYLAIATYIGLLNLTISAQILGMNRVDLYVRWIYVNLILMAVLLLVLVPSRVFGIDAFGLSYKGAAIASTISAIASYVIARWLTFSLIGAKPNPAILKHLAAATVAALVMHYSSGFYPMIRWFDAVVYLMIALAIFLSILRVMREFAIQDVRFFIRNLSIGRLASYVKEELSTQDEENK